MKINFRSSLNIEPQFAHLLDIILEPALEDRFSSSTAALENLLENNFSTFKSLQGSTLKLKYKPLYKDECSKIMSTILNFVSKNLNIPTAFL